MFHISSLIVLFLVGRSRRLLEVRIKVMCGGQKAGVRGRYGGRSAKWGFFAKFPLLSKTQTLSHKLLIRQTSNHHHCNQHAQKPYYRNFQVYLSSSSWSKASLCIFKEQIWLPNRKWYGKNKLYFDQEGMLKMAWYSTHIGFWMCQFQWHRFWGYTFRCFWVMGYMDVLSWKLLIIGLILEHFATLLKILHQKKIARKCSIFFHQLYFFLWKGQGHFGG